MNAGASGFRGAPLSKALLIAAVTGSVVVQAAAARAARRRMPLLLTAFTHAFAFRHPGELLFGAALCYYFRIFERQLGTGRYGAFVAAACVVAYALQGLLASPLAGRPSASGLYPLLFANLVPFALDVPALHRFSVCGMRMSDKAFIYLAALQLLLSGSQRSIAAGLCGLVAGLVYRIVPGMRTLRLPAAVEDLFANTFGRVLAGPQQPHHVYIAAAQQAQQQRPQAPTQPAGAPGPSQGSYSSVPEPSPEALRQLVDMGFDPGSAGRALQQASNNVELALQLLL